MLPPATWYPDPSGRHEHRYWDGRRWTQHVADAGIASIDPFEDRTADEQVDGGVAADIAAVALARTTTGDDTAAEAVTGSRNGRETGPATELADGPLVVVDTSRTSPPTARHDVQVRGRAVRIGMRVAGPGVLAAAGTLRRTVGTMDHDPTDHDDLRHLVGDGSMTLVGAQRVQLVDIRTNEDVHVRRDALVAVDGAAEVVAVPATGDTTDEDPPSVFDLRGASWAVVAASDLQDATLGAGERLHGAVVWVGRARLTADGTLAHAGDDGAVEVLRVCG